MEGQITGGKEWAKKAGRKKQNVFYSNEKAVTEKKMLHSS